MLGSAAEDPSAARRLPWLGDRIDNDRLALLHDLDAALEGGGHVLRIADRSDTGHTVRLRHLRVIDVGLDQSRSDMRAIDAAIPLRRHALNKHDLGVIAAIVVHDREQWDLVM